MLKSAKSYTSHGWAVFPCKPRGKEPLTPHGFKDASLNQKQLRLWWNDMPDANVAIVTGKTSGIVVLDVDVHGEHNGGKVLDALTAKFGDLPTTPHVFTGGGGEHFYFKYPQGAEIPTKALAPGIDLKSNGGYVIAPPSIHPSGQSYQWSPFAGPDDVELAPLPEWIIKMATVGKKLAKGKLPEVIPAGERNVMLTSVAGGLRRRGMTVDEIFEALKVVNEKRCRPPLPEREVQAIAESVGRYEPADAEQVKKTVLDAFDSDLQRELWSVLLGLDEEKKRPVAQRRKDAGQLLITWLEEHGGFVHGDSDRLFYFSRQDHELFPLETLRWRAWLHTLTCVNPASPDFAYLSADCQTAAEHAPRRQVVKVASWDDNEKVLRVDRFDGVVYVLDGENISEEPNGEHVLFEQDSFWRPYKPVFRRGALHWSTTELPNWAEKDEVYGLVFRAWVLSTFFTELCPARPLLVFLGEKGSGKSTALRVVLRFMFGPDMQLSGVPDKPDGFTAGASAAHVYVLDNLDQFTGWLRDKLARIATGASDEYRKLYTSNEVGHIRYRCWLAFTARTPDTLKRDDLADRLIILPVARLEDNGGWVQETVINAQVEALRGEWWGDVLLTLNDAVARIRKGELMGQPKLRMADWEMLGKVFAQGEDALDKWAEAVEDIRSTESDFLLEDDLLVEALQKWMLNVENHGREVTSRQLYESWTNLLFGDKKPPLDWPRSTKAFGRKLANIRRDLQKIYQVGWSKKHRTWYYRFLPKE